MLDYTIETEVMSEGYLNVCGVDDPIANVDVSKSFSVLPSKYILHL